jgi:hypothetical protein
MKNREEERRKKEKRRRKSAASGGEKRKKEKRRERSWSKGRKGEKRKKRKWDKVRHVAQGEWLGEDNEILPTNWVTPHGKGEISFIFKTLNLCELKWDPI